MPPEKIDSLADDVKQLVLELLEPRPRGTQTARRVRGRPPMQFQGFDSPTRKSGGVSFQARVVDVNGRGPDDRMLDQ
jgi:hypothetical protein